MLFFFSFLLLLFQICSTMATAPSYGIVRMARVGLIVVIRSSSSFHSSSSSPISTRITEESLRLWLPNFQSRDQAHSLSRVTSSASPTLRRSDVVWVVRGAIGKWDSGDEISTRVTEGYYVVSEVSLTMRFWCTVAGVVLVCDGQRYSWQGGWSSCAVLGDASRKEEQWGFVALMTERGSPGLGSARRRSLVIVGQ